MQSPTLTIIEQYFVDTEHLESRKDLKAFVKEATGVSEKDLQTKDLQPGSPKLVIVSGAALRVADVVRSVYRYIFKRIYLLKTSSRDLRGIAGNGEVAKLFAKHFKLAEHVSIARKYWPTLLTVRAYAVYLLPKNEIQRGCWHTGPHTKAHRSRQV